MVVAPSSGGHLMDCPAFTGDVARCLGVIEPRLNDVIRKGGVSPLPKVVGGRRLWEREQILQAAEYLGVPTDDLRLRLNSDESEVVRG
jgi:hypothetical protein